MFGFVTVNQQDLSESELARYRQVYCGVCRALQERSGNVSRFALNHDLVFVAIMLMSLYEPEEDEGMLRCAAHPLKQRPYTANRYIDYAADMTVLMAYFKLLDNWEDDRSHASLAVSKMLESAYKRVRERCPRQNGATEAGLAKIAQVEKASEDEAYKHAHLDEAARLFGEIMAEVFVYEEDMWAAQLRRFGFELGRFIYLMDAAVDVGKDAKSGSYNPFVGAAFSEDEVRMLLASYMARATDVFERLPLVQDAHIMRSVLYSGVWMRLSAEEEKRRKDRGEDDAPASAGADPCDNEENEPSFDNVDEEHARG